MSTLTTITRAEYVTLIKEEGPPKELIVISPEELFCHHGDKLKIKVYKFTHCPSVLPEAQFQHPASVVVIISEITKDIEFSKYNCFACFSKEEDFANSAAKLLQRLTLDHLKRCGMMLVKDFAFPEVKGIYCFLFVRCITSCQWV